MKPRMIRVLFLIVVGVLFFNTAYSAKNIKNTDVIIFSFDRPLQLYAVLEICAKIFFKCEQGVCALSCERSAL